MRRVVSPVCLRSAGRIIGAVLAIAAVAGVNPAAAQADWWDVHVHVDGPGRVIEPHGDRDCRAPLSTPTTARGADCKMAFGTSAFPYGRTLVAEVPSGDGWQFRGWDGDCAETDDKVCHLVIPGAWRSGSRDVHAKFAEVKEPDTELTGAPPSIVSSRSARFSFTSNEAEREGSTYTCKLDEENELPCGSGLSYEGLKEGSHTFAVRARDPSGNRDASPATHSWIVDTIAPSPHIVSGPSGFVRSTIARFEFTAGESTWVECSLDGASWTRCDTLTNHQYTGLSQGAHTFRVHAIDAAGNANGAVPTATWTVDTVAPDTRVDAGPEDGATTTATTATFGFRTDPEEPDASFECKLDGGSFGACSGPGANAIVSGLEPGRHEFAVRAVDRAGNADPTPAARSWTVTKPPNLDVDGDGYQRRPEGPDCDDAAGHVHPSANDLPENGVDEDCDGVDRRYGSLGADVRATWKMIGKRTKVVRLVAIRVPGGTSIEVRCKGKRKGCRRQVARFKVARDTPEVTIGGSLRKALRKQARVIVRLTKPDTKGVHVKYRIRNGKSPARIDRCLSPVNGKKIDC